MLIPTCPLAFTKRAVVPAAVATFMSAPVPNCLTVRPVDVPFENTRQLLVLMTVGKLGAA